MLATEDQADAIVVDADKSALRVFGLEQGLLGLIIVHPEKRTLEVLPQRAKNPETPSQMPPSTEPPAMQDPPKVEDVVVEPNPFLWNAKAMRGTPFIDVFALD
jgi:hypothetical protein